MGVSVLFNKCVTCSNTAGLLILGLSPSLSIPHSLFIKNDLLVIADLMAILLILLLDTHLPSWIYPFIFYIQVSNGHTDSMLLSMWLLCL